MPERTLQALVTNAGMALEAAGIIVIVLGALFALVMAVAEMRRGRESRETYQAFRRRLGGGILLGLEFLIAGDIIRTVAVEPSFRSVGVLAGIVAIRTFLSFTLTVEMTGKWPWQEGGV